MTSSFKDSPEYDLLNQLLPKLVDDVLSDEDTKKLVSILQNSLEAQTLYLQYIDLHSELYAQWGSGDHSHLRELVGKVPQAPAPVPPVGHGFGDLFSQSMTPVAWLFLATTFIALGFLLARGQVAAPRANELALESPKLSTESVIAEALNQSPKGFVAELIDVEPDAAVLVRVENVDSADLVVGRRLKKGVVKLSQGMVQLEFMSGAIVALQGPAELHILSKDAATLASGTVSARVPNRAKGFVINAPDTAVVDLGTEFGVSIDETGVSEVEVLSGEVELSLVGRDGNTVLSRRVNEASRVRVDSVERSLNSVEHPTPDLPEIVLSDETGLIVSEEYVDLVQSKQPEVFWRFEESNATVVRNEMSDRLAVNLQRVDEDEDCLRVVDGHIQLRRCNSSRYLITEDTIQGIHEDDYSIELWIKPDDLQHASCLGVFPHLSKDAHDQMNLIEIVTDTFMIHEPGAIRFLDRYPPSRSYEHGTNIFSSGICRPGQWQHVVVVKKQRFMEMYHNGQMVSQLDVADTQGKGEFRVILGQLTFNRGPGDWRQFAGAIDEVAIYRRSLSGIEIDQHFQLIADANGLN